MSEALDTSANDSLSHWVSAQASHKGNVRPINEDAVYEGTENRIWAVADGMGGHEAGDTASAAIVSALADVGQRDDLASLVDAVEDALLQVNDDLKQYARSRFGGETVGSTVVVMVAQGHLGVTLWAGDSRLYRLRGDNLEQITRDHNPISDLLDSGAVSEEEAINADTNIITRAVGGQGPLNMDIVAFDIETTDRFLLCTDGLYREVDSAELAHCLQLDVERCAATLVDRCLAGRAHDNLSLVVAHPGPCHG